MDQNQQSDHVALLLQLHKAVKRNSQLVAEIQLLKQRNQILSERVEDTTRAYKAIKRQNKNLGLEFQIAKKILIDTFEIQTAQLREQLNDQRTSQIELSHANQSLLGSIHSYKQQHQALHAKLGKQRGEILELKQHIECNKSHVIERDAKLVEYDTIINDQNITIDDLRQKLEIKSHNVNNLRVKSTTPMATWNRAMTIIPNQNASVSDSGSMFSEMYRYKGGSSLFSVTSTRDVWEETFVEPWPLLAKSKRALSIPNSITGMSMDIFIEDDLDVN